MSKSLRELLRTESCTLVPGVYDCVSAMIAEKAGFSIVGISGYGVEASLFGLPDLGFTGLTDIATVADRIVSAVSVPVCCDADTGFGGANNVRETVRRLEKAGVQGLHFEDQEMPKKCGGISGKGVVPIEEMVGKIKAATDARKRDDLVIIARTDAKESRGIEEVIHRLNTYLEAGADVAFAAESYTREEVRRLGAEVSGKLAICAGVPGWSGSFETREVYGSWGINLAFYPFTSLYPVARILNEVYARMAREQGVSERFAAETMVGFDWFSDFIGVPVWQEREMAARSAGSPQVD